VTPVTPELLKVTQPTIPTAVLPEAFCGNVSSTLQLLFEATYEPSAVTA
jgi:hypothetical protein